MAKPTKKTIKNKAEPKKAELKKVEVKKVQPRKAEPKKTIASLSKALKPKKAQVKVKRKAAPHAEQLVAPAKTSVPRVAPPLALGVSPSVLDRLWDVVMDRRDADPAVSHSARLMSRGTGKVAQKFGEEAVECLIEATSGTREGLIGESADVLYHLIVVWVNANIHPSEIWAELQKREGISGIAEKASRAKALPAAFGVNTTKIP